MRQVWCWLDECEGSMIGGDYLSCWKYCVFTFSYKLYFCSIELCALLGAKSQPSKS